MQQLGTKYIHFLGKLPKLNSCCWYTIIYSVYADYINILNPDKPEYGVVLLLNSKPWKKFLR